MSRREKEENRGCRDRMDENIKWFHTAVKKDLRQGRERVREGDRESERESERVREREGERE